MDPNQDSGLKKKIVIGTSIFLCILLFVVIGFYVNKRQRLVSPLPEENGNDVRVIFVSPIPSASLVMEASPSATPKTSVKPTSKPTPKPTPKPSASISASASATFTP